MRTIFTVLVYLLLFMVISAKVRWSGESEGPDTATVEENGNNNNNNNEVFCYMLYTVAMQPDISLNIF